MSSSATRQCAAEAAERIARGEGTTAIAGDLRVSVRSVQRWRHAWAEGGPRSLRSQGPASLPRLSDLQFAQLEAKGPAAHGWEDQRQESAERREARRRIELPEQENEVLRRAAAYLSQANLPGKGSTRS